MCAFIPNLKDRVFPLENHNYIGNGEKYRQRPSYEVIFLSGLGKKPISSKYLTISI